jgi:hypothetical protein
MAANAQVLRQTKALAQLRAVALLRSDAVLRAKLCHPATQKRIRAHGTRPH